MNVLVRLKSFKCKSLFASSSGLAGFSAAFSLVPLDTVFSVACAEKYGLVPITVHSFDFLFVFVWLALVGLKSHRCRLSDAEPRQGWMGRGNRSSSNNLHLSSNLCSLNSKAMHRNL